MFTRREALPVTQLRPQSALPSEGLEARCPTSAAIDKDLFQGHCSSRNLLMSRKQNLVQVPQ